MAARDLSESWTWKTSPKLGALEKRGEFENGCKVKRSQCNCISAPVGLDMHELAVVFSRQLSTSVKCTSSVRGHRGRCSAPISCSAELSCATLISGTTLLVVAHQSLCCANTIWRHKHVLQLRSPWEKLRDQIYCTFSPRRASAAICGAGL